MPDKTETQPEPWSAGHLVANRYEILEHLGTGGMGVVYRVKDTKAGRIRALKTIRQDLKADTKLLVAKLLKSEADALNRLESDFVVRVFDASFDGAQPFVIMEFLPGRDLQRVLDAEGPLPVHLAVSLLWQAACALRAIHEQGIVHRDLKPANLYLKTRDDGSLELKVLDFSISRLLDRAGERKTTMVVGTRGFMAPEQAAGYDVDHRADIYALGQVANAFLRGPIKPDATGQASDKVTAQPEAFRAWFKRATAYHREQRFSSSTEAIEVLAQALGVPLPSQEIVKPDSQESLAAAATILGTSKRGRVWGTWAIALASGAATVVGLLLLTRSDPNGALRGARGAAAATAALAAPHADERVALPTPSTNPVGLATTAVASPAAAAEARRRVSSTAKASQAVQKPARPQRPSDTF